MLEKEGLAIWFLNRICQLQGEDEIDTSFLPNGEANIVLFLKKSVQIFISLGLSKECGWFLKGSFLLLKINASVFKNALAIEVK